MNAKPSKKAAATGIGRPASEQNSKWTAKMKEKLKVALRNEPVQAAEHDINPEKAARKSSNGPVDGRAQPANGTASRRKRKRKGKGAVSSSAQKQGDVEPKTPLQNAAKARPNKGPQKPNKSKQSKITAELPKHGSNANGTAEKSKKSRSAFAETTNDSAKKSKSTTSKGGKKRSIGATVTNGPDGRAKRFKLSNGFIESNANDAEETERIGHLLRVKQSKRERSTDLANAGAPPVIVHSVAPGMAGLETDSNSETESYIDKFFDENDDCKDNVNGTCEEQQFPADNVNDAADQLLQLDHFHGNIGSDDSGSEYYDEANGHSAQDSDATSDNFDGGYSDSDQNSTEISSSDEDSTDYSTESDSCSDSDGWEYSDSDDAEYGTLSDCSSYESLGSEVPSENSYSYCRHSENCYNSDDDSDYADDNYDDMRIASGTATTYKLPEKYMNIFEDSDSQLIELSRTDSEDEECPTLVSIGIDRNIFLANEKTLAACREKHAADAKTRAEQNAADYAQKLQDYYEMDMRLVSSRSAVGLESTPAPPTNARLVECSKADFKNKHLKLGDEAGVDVAAASDAHFITFPKIKQKSCSITSVNCGRPAKSHAQAASIQQQTCTPQIGGATDPKPADSPESQNAPNKAYTDAKSGTLDQPLRSRPEFFNALDSRHVLLLLRKGIFFHGNLKVKLIAGSATIFGHRLQLNKAVTVHSPRGHGTIFIQPLPSDTAGAQRDLDGLEGLAAVFYSHDIVAVRERFDPQSDAILLLERDMDNKSVLMIDRYMRETMLPNINAFNSNREFYSSEFVLHANFSDRPKRGLVLADQWSGFALQKHAKLVTIGGKGVGKSTFQRYAINSNLSRLQKFVFIDLDIGQPEFFVPQTLSVHVVAEPILGPGYLRNIKPAKSVFFGDITVMPDPIKYLQCVLDIYKFCATRAEFRDMPWIVNTMGFSRGLGNELIACILKLFQPSDVVQIQCADHSQNFDAVMTADTVNAWKFNIFDAEVKHLQRKCAYRLHLFDQFIGDQQSKRKPEMSAADLRFAMILSKLGGCLKSNSDWLSSVRPFEVSLGDLHIVLANHEGIDKADYLNILSGSLVYLCSKTAESATIDCHGIGIVRSIDKMTDKLYIIATITLDELCVVNALAIGSIPLPSVVLLNQHSHIHGNVPYVYNSDDFIGSKQVVHHQYRAVGNPNRRSAGAIHHKIC